MRRKLAIAAAREAGAHPGPDYRFGYGLFDAPGAVALLEADLLNTARPHLKEILLHQGGEIEFTVDAPGGADLKVTAVWTDPPPTNVGTSLPALDDQTPRLVNDLDLRVLAPDTTEWRPWVLDPDLTQRRQSVRELPAARGDDSRNNVEQVLVETASLAPGRYTVRVTSKGALAAAAGEVGEQWLSLVVTGNVAEVFPAPRVATVTEQSNNLGVLVRSVVAGSNYMVQFTPDLALGTWTDHLGPINAAKEEFSVFVEPPPATPNVFFRLVELP